MPEKQEALKQMKKEHGKKIVDKVTIDQLIGGARSIKCMLWETSLLDAEEGIRFRGLTIPELQKALPSYSGKEGDEPMPEALFWLLLTGEVPTKAQADALTQEFHSRAKLPAHVEPMIRSFPKGARPPSTPRPALDVQARFGASAATITPAARSERTRRAGHAPPPPLTARRGVWQGCTR